MNEIEIQDVRCVIEKLELSPGDILVFKALDGYISREAMNRIFEYLEDMFKRIGLENRIGVLVVEKDFEIKLVRLSDE